MVPLPPDRIVAERLQDWWTRPRTFGCPHVTRTGRWWVVYPSPDVVCGECVLERFADERRCIYCGTNVDMTDDTNVFHESAGFLLTFARAHTACAEEAAR